MSGPEFFQTVMGKRFFEVTMPELVAQIKRLNDNLEALANNQEQKAKFLVSPNLVEIIKEISSTTDYYGEDLNDHITYWLTNGLRTNAYSDSDQMLVKDFLSLSEHDRYVIINEIKV